MRRRVLTLSIVSAAVRAIGSGSLALLCVHELHHGCLLPTSIGANPQLSIYGIVNRLTQGLQRLGGREVALA